MAFLALAAAVAVAVAVLGSTMMTNGQVPATKPCQPCSKILMPVCGVDDYGEHKTFSNPCVLEWCNCILFAADSSQQFTMKQNRKCTGFKTNETAVPECFPEEAEEEEGGEEEEGDTQEATEDVTEDITDAGETTPTSTDGSPGSRTLHNSTTGNHTGSASPLAMGSSHMLLSLSVAVLVLGQLV